jgi:hypothetical protein
VRGDLRSRRADRARHHPRDADDRPSRANDLLEEAAQQLLGYAILAEEVHATPAANRTPGVADGTSRQAASLHLLAIIFGSVVGNRASGTAYEQSVLASLGITKNTETWRPDPAFEGKLTPTGLAKGTTPDGWGSNYLLEIKGTSQLQFRYQLRLQVEQANQLNQPLWIIKAAGQQADSSVTKAAEGTKGGVVYRSSNGTYTDGQGNPVQVTYDKGTDRLTVQGYKPVYGAQNTAGGSSGLSSAQPGDADAPSGPVNPAVADGTASVEPATPDGPNIFDDPDDPEIIVP